MIDVLVTRNVRMFDVFFTPSEYEIWFLNTFKSVRTFRWNREYTWYQILALQSKSTLTSFS